MSDRDLIRAALQDPVAVEVSESRGEMCGCDQACRLAAARGRTQDVAFGAGVLIR